MNQRCMRLIKEPVTWISTGGLFDPVGAPPEGHMRDERGGAKMVAWPEWRRKTVLI
jgi:hypothetical protein